MTSICYVYVSSFFKNLSVQNSGGTTVPSRVKKVVYVEDFYDHVNNEVMYNVGYKKKKNTYKGN